MSVRRSAPTAPLRLPDGSVPDIFFVDLDGTLISVSSEKCFLRHLVGQRILGVRNLMVFAAGYLLHPLRTLREGKGWNRLYLRSLPPQAVRREAVECAGAIAASQMRIRTLDMLEELSNSGCRTVVMSASLDCIVRGIAEGLPVDCVCASVPQTAEGSFTGRLEDVRPWGLGKVELALRICREYGVALERCAAAGDSWPDRFLLAESGCPVAVCPDRRLKEMALEKGWRMLEGSHTRWA